MSSRFIPKDQTTDFKRWEIGSFDSSGKRPAPATPPPPPSEEIKLPTAAELEAIQQQAYQEGYQAGLKQAQMEGEQLRKLSLSFTQSINEIEKSVAEELLTLSLNIAKQVLREALAVKPELVLPVVREALHSLSEAQQNNILRLNPADVEVVTRHLGDELNVDGWRIIADEQIEAGGCRVESANGEVNATLATRWQRIISTLGRDDGWLS
ncbi:MAG: flagellar assembly protein FliH [Pseudomonadota bacterium]